MVTNNRLIAARDVMFQASTECDEARRKMWRAEAIFCGLCLLKYSAQLYPGVTGWYYSWESEYDDEGGYYDSTYVRPQVDEEVAGHREAAEKHGEPDEDYDNLDVWSKQALEFLFGAVDEVCSVQYIEQKVKELQARG